MYTLNNIDCFFLSHWRTFTDFNSWLENPKSWRWCADIRRTNEGFSSLWGKHNFKSVLSQMVWYWFGFSESQIFPPDVTLLQPPPLNHFVECRISVRSEWLTNELLPRQCLKKILGTEQFGKDSCTAICILLGNIAVSLGSFKIQTVIRPRKSLKLEKQRQ